ncbi:ATP-binding protein [Pseudoalteromonas sp.]|uniref:ATP-binding protein n=1 Tax=Pseudoalteromonas sp. TaxID=53249 RepID=UPI00356AC8D1
MKKFYISLLSSALLSIIILGWLIDAFSQQAHSPQDEFSVQSKVIAGFSQQLQAVALAERSHFVKQLATDFKLPLEYKLTDSVALAPALQQQMYNHGGLILEDQQGFYLLYSSQAISPYHLAMRLERSFEHEQRNDIMLTLLFYAALCVVMGFIILPLGRRLTQLNEAAKKFAAGDVHARIKVSHFTYIKDVELTFNRMASQIEKLVAENKLMASSLSHDIRTPIACLRFGLDAALECADKTKLKQYLTRMENDLDQMESMLKSYLAFATLEQNANRLTYSTTSLKSYFEDILTQLAPKLQARNLSVQLSCSDDVIYADLHWLARAVTNLINNACDFAAQHIYISAALNEHELIINVEDDGPGVANENAAKVFSPFYREKNHRNRADQSYGLGLAIVAKVADWHHGDVQVSHSCYLGGAYFTLKIAQHHHPVK